MLTKVKFYTIEQLETIAGDYCTNMCTLRGLEYCLLVEGATGVACPVQNYVDYLSQGKTRRF